MICKVDPVREQCVVVKIYAVVGWRLFTDDMCLVFYCCLHDYIYKVQKMHSKLHLVKDTM